MAARTGTAPPAFPPHRSAEASRAEVLASMDSGLPALREVADADGPAAAAAAELDRRHAAALKLIPAAT